MNEYNQRLVASVAKLFEGQGLTHEELVIAGNEGLLEAEKHYVKNSQFGFTAYAVWWIRQCIIEAVKEQQK